MWCFLKALKTGATNPLDCRSHAEVKLSDWSRPNSPEQSVDRFSSPRLLTMSGSFRLSGTSGLRLYQLLIQRPDTPR